MSALEGAASPPPGRPLARAAQVIIVSSVMFSFISYWRIAAIVLCDMSSTVYYIGAIVESAIGKAAPWFILAVLLFSYAMRAVYIESSGMFVRGGVYRVVKEAMGGFLAKLSVSALLFDYVLTGPISGVSAGQYIVGLGLEALTDYTSMQIDEGTRQAIKSWGSVLIACAITLYFFRQNLLGIHESSGKALKIMVATTVMGAIMLAWCGVTLAVKVVAIRSPQNLFMLEKALAETDPKSTDVVVMTAKVAPADDTPGPEVDLDDYDQHLMTAVVEKAESSGKQVKPLIVSTNSPLHAVLRTAKDIQAQEVVLGASNKFTAEEQLDQISFYWINLHEGQPPGLTVRILSRDRDVTFDLGGGNRIPKVSERQARSVAELRAAGVGIDRLLLAHDGTLASRDLFQSVLTMLDPEVVLDLVLVTPEGQPELDVHRVIPQDQKRARHLGRELQVHAPVGDLGPEIVRLAREGRYDLIILSIPAERPTHASRPWPEWTDHVLSHAHCQVLLAVPPAIPRVVTD